MPPLRKVVDRALSLWQNASPNEKLAISAAIAAAVSLAGFAVNLLFHVSLILSFSIIPLLLAPILLAVIASLTAFAFFTMMTAGAGIFFIGTPFVAIALLAKSLFAILVIVGGVSGIVASVLGIKSEKEESEAVVFDVEEEDEFERFDKRLRRRSVGREKGWDVSSWGMSEVIDELGFTGLGEYRQLFIEERIDGRTLLELTDDDIRSEFAAAMPLGDRMRLGRLVSELRKRASRLP